MRAEWGALFLGVFLVPGLPAQGVQDQIETGPVDGKDLGAWSNEIYRWLLSASRDRAPNRALDGSVCQFGQMGNVFFLAGSPNKQRIIRSCSVPEGKHLLLALLSCYNFNDPGDSLSEPQLIQDCKDAVDALRLLSFTLGGQELDPSVLFSLRRSGVLNDLTLPANSWTGSPAGVYDPVIHDGYYLMLKPLPPGPHEIHVLGCVGSQQQCTNPQDWNDLSSFFWVDVTYQLTVAPAASFHFRRGDSNGDGTVDLSDAIATLNALFLGGEQPPCEDLSDAQDDGSVNLSDAVYVINYLFLAGDRPPSPGPSGCGEDPTRDTLLGCHGGGGGC